MAEITKLLEQLGTVLESMRLSGCQLEVLLQDVQQKQSANNKKKAQLQKKEEELIERERKIEGIEDLQVLSEEVKARCEEFKKQKNLFEKWSEKEQKEINHLKKELEKDQKAIVADKEELKKEKALLAQKQIEHRDRIVRDLADIEQKRRDLLGRRR